MAISNLATKSATYGRTLGDGKPLHKPVPRAVHRLATIRVSGAYRAKLLPVADRPAHAVERPINKLHDHEVFVHAVFVA
jgi:hypothetical protein